MPGTTTTKNIIPEKNWQALLTIREARTILVDAASVTADANGKKIVPAGAILGSATTDVTILGGNASAKVVNDATAEGILVNAVDVTNGDVEGAMAYAGTANIRKLPVAPAAAAVAAMTRLTFMSV